ncbi:MAG: hypothetical protein ABIV51_01215 [Saprospiraceae bacterium]
MIRSILLLNAIFGALALLGPNRGLFAQTVTISSEINIEDEVEYEVLGKFRRQLYLLEAGSSDVAFRIFDENLAQQETVFIPLESKKSRLIRVIASKDQIHVLYTIVSEDSLKIKAIHLDDALNVIDTVTYWSQAKDIKLPYFKADYSEDKSKVLLHAIKGPAKLLFIALDLKDRSVLWEKEINFEKAEFLDVFRKMLISNQGQMFLTLEKSNTFSEKSEHSFEILTMSKSRGLETISIPAPQFLSADIQIKMDDLNGQMTAFGLGYTQDAREINGVFHIKVPFQYNDHYTLTNIPFDQEMLADYYGKELNKANYLEDIKIHTLLIRQDGGIVFFLEQQREMARQSYQVRRDFYNGARFSVDYYYDNLVSMGISAGGEVEFQKVLHKKQYSHDDDALFSSIFTMVTPRYVRILFNDDIRNESTVSEYLMNGKGSIERKNVMSTEKQKLRLQIKNATQLAYNEIVIPSIRNNKLKLVRVVY